MKSKLFAGCLIALAASACQPSDYIDPQDDPTGTSPEAQIFKFEAASAPRFLNANLEASNALQAEYTVVNDVLVPMQVGGAFPESAGADADLLAGVGFGTYPNPDRNSTTWTEGSFQSRLTADVILTKPGDAVKFCRTFATTCATVQMTADGGGLVVLNLAANVPDTEIGEIAPGVSAAIRGTGESGLTIAVTDPTVVARPFTVTAGTPFTLEWTVARGPITGLPEGAGSISYSVSVDGTELASSDTLAALAGAIAKEGGVAMKFDLPPGAELKTEVDYTYSFQGVTGNFDDPFAFVGASDVAVSPQLDLGALPLLVYPTLNPGIPILTLGGDPSAPYAAQPSDAVLGAIGEPPAPGEQVTISSAAFNGDDFAGTPVAGAVDQGIAGGGFYPSPAFCYAQIYPQINALVRAGARKEVHRQMYAAIANGVANADASLEQLAGALSQPYTRLGDVAAEDNANYILIGTDYADSNVDTNITTSVNDTYTVMLNQAVSTTFRDQLNAIITAWENAENPPSPPEFTNPAYAALKGLQIGLTTPPGVKDGKVDEAGTPVVDDPAAGICAGYDCQVAVVFADKINGTNNSETNDPNDPEDNANTAPLLAHVCLWGRPAAPAEDAKTAVLTVDGNDDNDAPAYAAVPAQPALLPVREQAAAQLNSLILGIFGNFIGQVFGPTVPASNFSLSMAIGDPAGDTSPAVSSIVITAQ